MAKDNVYTFDIQKYPFPGGATHYHPASAITFATALGFAAITLR